MSIEKKTRTHELTTLHNRNEKREKNFPECGGRIHVTYQSSTCCETSWRNSGKGAVPCRDWDQTCRPTRSSYPRSKGNAKILQHSRVLLRQEGCQRAVRRNSSSEPKYYVIPLGALGSLGSYCWKRSFARSGLAYGYKISLSRGSRW